nr:7-deoxyloganetic acid glucosyltransferase-like [Ipomoea batatas]
MDMPIATVKGMEDFLRYRDLPAHFRVDDIDNDPFLKFFLEVSHNIAKSKHHIINTFQELEEPILHLMSAMMSNVYAVEPLHEFLAANGGSSNVIMSDDDNTKSCLDWLDNQPLKSVLYGSFGTVTMVSRETLVEFWHGLVNSGQRFLWSLTSNLVTGGEIPAEILTEAWKVGLEMKDTCHRVIIEKMVREVMEERKDEFLERAQHYSKMAKQSVRQGGSSYSNLERLLEDIRRI